MTLAITLTRIPPTDPGTFIAILVKPQQGQPFTRFFPADTGHLSAEALCLTQSAKGNDVYFAVNAFSQRRRVQTNLAGSRALYIDADVARPGDGKDPAKVFADRRAAWTWLFQFCAATRLPLPNVTIDSGYGYHWYWVLDTVLDAARWQPLAEAFKNAMIAHGWTGDTNSTIDSARILRPPGVSNHKVPGAPAPTMVVANPNLPTVDHSYTLIENILQAYVGLVVGGSAPNTAANRVGTPSRRTKVVQTLPTAVLGPPPAHVTPGVSPNLNAAAHANLGGIFEPHQFANIAQRCKQAEQTLAANGAGDSYSLWYLGWLTLLDFCEDGDQFVHPVSSGHAKYNTANVDAHYARAQGEIVTKGLSPPTCATFDAARPGVCSLCPYAGKITSPAALGYPVDPIADLPDNYKRHNGNLEVLLGNGKNQRWVRMLPGDVANPWIERVSTGHRIHFDYLFGGTVEKINALDGELGAVGVGVAQSLSRMGITASKGEFELIGGFLVAWIKQLRAQRTVRRDGLPPFGWTTDEQGNHLGFAVAGTHYRADGREEVIAQGDPEIAEMYTPRGTLAEWRKVAALVETSDAPLQLLAATALAAPLVSLASDVKGMNWNFYSLESGAGKTTMMRIAQSVWGATTALSSATDTINSVVNMLGMTRVLPRFWDEMTVQPDRESQVAFSDLMYYIPQGRERSRLTSTAKQQVVREWETMLVIASNLSLNDFMVQSNGATDSGVQRIFQVKLWRNNMPYDEKVGMILKLYENNYGHAGRIYAKYLAENRDAVQQSIITTMGQLTKALNIRQEERYLVVAMACALVGADLGNKLGLFKFDIAGILGCLRTSLADIRSLTKSNVIMVKAGTIDLDQVLSEFVQHESSRRLRTNIFGVAGSKKPVVYSEPQNKGSDVTVHIAQDEQMMRLDMKALREWLKKRSLPVTDVINQVKAICVQNDRLRHSLAAATDWATPQKWVYDIPLTGTRTVFLDAIDQLRIAGLEHLQQGRTNAPIKPNTP